jgi:hypothetical protein
MNSSTLSWKQLRRTLQRSGEGNDVARGMSHKSFATLRVLWLAPGWEQEDYRSRRQDGLGGLSEPSGLQYRDNGSWTGWTSRDSCRFESRGRKNPCNRPCWKTFVVSEVGFEFWEVRKLYLHQRRITCKGCDGYYNLQNLSLRSHNTSCRLLLWSTERRDRDLLFLLVNSSTIVSHF